MINLFELAKKIFPINRSLTGEGVRQTFSIFKDQVPELKIGSIASGSKVFGWTVPQEWKIDDAYVKDSRDQRVVDFKSNNLHVVGYSVPVTGKFWLKDLRQRLHTVPEIPEAIPYVTSYFQREWGFCLSETTYKSLREDEEYLIHIDSELFDGELNYADIIIPGDSKKEIVFSTYVCHPSMANNEVSGPVILMGLANYIKNLSSRRFTYRIIFAPETLGTLAYIQSNFEDLKAHTLAGFVISCVGDDGSYSLTRGRRPDSLPERIVKFVSERSGKVLKEFSWLQRGSDERQYCAPNIDLPFVTLSRSRFSDYPEYHTSLDDLEFISPEGLDGSLWWMQEIVDQLEIEEFFETTCVGEPQLGAVGLYSNLSKIGSSHESQIYLDIISLCDGTMSLREISENLNVPLDSIRAQVKILVDKGFLRPL